MIVIVADAVFNPVFQALQRHHRQNARCLLEQLRQTGTGKGRVMPMHRTGCAVHHVADNFDISGKQDMRMQQSRYSTTGLQKWHHRLEIGMRRHVMGKFTQFYKRFFPYHNSHCGSLFKIHQQRLRTAPHFTEKTGILDIHQQTLTCKQSLGSFQAIIKDSVNLSKITAQTLPVDFKLHASCHFNRHRYHHPDTASSSHKA